MIRYDLSAATGRCERRPNTAPSPQAELFPVIERPSYRAGMTREEMAEAFDRLNPHVYAFLRAQALALVEARVRRFSMRMLWEVLRHRMLVDRGGSRFALNNDILPAYARRLAAEPWMPAGTIEIRERGTT